MNLKKIAKETGIKTIRKDALEELELYVQQQIRAICVQADLLREHSGRKTVLQEDIKLAILVGK